MMTNSEAIAVFLDKDTNLSTSNCNGEAYKLLNPMKECAIKALEENDKLKSEIEQLKVELEQSIKLPCKVGDVVYEIFRGKIQEYTVISINLSDCSHLYGWRIKTENGVYSNLNGFEESAIGSRIFLTREEAEQSLKGKVEE